MEGARGCWLSAAATPEGGWLLQWQVGDHKEGDFVALCPVGKCSRKICTFQEWGPEPDVAMSGSVDE